MATPTTYYVDIARAGYLGNGLTWNTAFGSLQAGIIAASTGDTILVREGTYALTSTGSSFVIDGRNIYGGFDTSYSGSDPLDADPAVNVTILTGVIPNSSEFAYHVVKATTGGGILAGFTIEGGEADGSNPDDRGGGIQIVGASPVISECIIRSNKAATGGGMYVFNSDAIITNCRIENNTAASGGGAFVYLVADLEKHTGPLFEDVDFVHNTATGGGAGPPAGGGGAKVYSALGERDEQYDNTRFVSCDFTGNRISFTWNNYCQSTALGAGLLLTGSADLTDCKFVDNGPWNGECNESAINGGAVAINNLLKVDPGVEGGGDEYFLYFTAAFRDCVFRQNGHISVTDEDCDLPDGIPNNFVDQTDFVNFGGGVYLQRSSPANPFDDPTFPHFDATFDDCNFIGNVAGSGGAVFTDRATARFNDCDFMDNDADGRTAHVDFDYGAPPNNCDGPWVYVQPTSAYGGGAMSTYRLSYFEVTDCKFARNFASLWSGGAIYPYEGTTMIIDRCYFVGNEARAENDENLQNGLGKGGAIWNNSKCIYDSVNDTACEVDRAAECFVYNSLLVGNYARGDGGAVYAEKAAVTQLVNCTIINNKAGHWTGGVYVDSETTAARPQLCETEIYNCIVWGNSDDGWTGSADDQRIQVFERRWNATPPAPWPTAGYCDIQSDGNPALSVYTNTSGGNNIGDQHGTPDHDPDVPVTVSSGTWTTLPSYNPATGRTTFTDTAATVTDWTNSILVARSAGSIPSYIQRSIIVAVNSANHTIEVLGDLTAGNHAYDIESYRIATTSPCTDAGSNAANTTLQDIIAQGRIDDISEIIDMGCYEYWEEIP